MRVAVLGSSGFVGKNLLQDFSNNHETKGFYRSNKEDNSCFFDIESEASWQTIPTFNPEIVINCVGYGVVREQKDFDKMIAINYLQTVKLFDFLFNNCRNTFLIHIGSAFEYDLAKTNLTEETECIPSTKYGISKFLSSHFLLQKANLKNFCILRPFNMFGPYENEGKIVPSLILAQKRKISIPLSSGLQERDFFYVRDISTFIQLLIQSNKTDVPRVINVGTGKPRSILEVGNLICKQIEFPENNLWRWGEIPMPLNESKIFFNASQLCYQLGFRPSELQNGLRSTIKYYQEYV